MRAVTAVALLLMTTPFAAADQDLSVGPLALTTRDQSTGSGCSSDEGGIDRTAHAHLDDPRGGGAKDVDLNTYCDRRATDEGPDDSAEMTLVVSNTEFNSTGPGARFTWRARSSPTGSSCGSEVEAASLLTPLGCPSPAGTGPPMIPPLP